MDFGCVAQASLITVSMLVVTTLEGRVKKDQAGLLVDGFGAVSDSLPPSILESFLLHDADETEPLCAGVSGSLVWLDRLR